MVTCVIAGWTGPEVAGWRPVGSRLRRFPRSGCSRRSRRSPARQRRRPAVVADGGTTAIVGLAASAGKSPPGRVRVTVIRSPSASRPTASLSRGAAQVVGGAPDVEEERGEGRGGARVDDTEPRADDIVGGQVRAVGELQVVTEGEDDRLAAVPELPPGRERGLRDAVGVERGEALEELRDDVGTRRVTGGRRVERRGGAHEDLRVAVGGPRHGGEVRRCAHEHGHEGGEEDRGRPQGGAPGSGGRHGGSIRGRPAKGVRHDSCRPERRAHGAPEGRRPEWRGAPGAGTLGALDQASRWRRAS